MALHSASTLAPRGQREDIRLSSGQVVLNFHSDGQCLGNSCPVHRPSAHPLLELPLAFVGGHMVRIIPGAMVIETQGVIIPEYSAFPVAITIDPDDYGFVQQGRAIVRNSGYCGICGDHIVSQRVHDFRSCSCGVSSVDGGSAYLRRSGKLIESSLVFYAKPREI